jgi:rod shape-determining protein MreC
VIGNSTVASAKAVFIDRGYTSGIEKGMAVVTPDGIVGKVVAVYPLVAQVLLVTDATFKVGVESQKGHVHGVLACGSGACTVEQIQEEEKVTPGEWFFTSGEDRIFPKGFPVGTVISVQPGQGMKDVKLNLSGGPGGVEEVLVVLQGVHQPIPVGPVVEDAAMKALPPPPQEPGNDSKQPNNQPRPTQTEADKVVQKYQQIGKEQNHVYGGLASGLPNFNAKPGATPATNPAGGTAPGTVTNPKPSEPKAAAPVRAAPKPVLPLGAPRPKPSERAAPPPQ